MTRYEDSQISRKDGSKLEEYEDIIFRLNTEDRIHQKRLAVVFDVSPKTIWTAIDNARKRKRLSA